jgi:hypothetical protein
MTSGMVLDGKVRFSDRLQDRLGYGGTLPEREGRAIRFRALATFERTSKPTRLTH